MEAEKAMGVNHEEAEFPSQAQAEPVAYVTDLLYRV